MPQSRKRCGKLRKRPYTADKATIKRLRKRIMAMEKAMYGTEHWNGDKLGCLYCKYGPEGSEPEKIPSEYICGPYDADWDCRRCSGSYRGGRGGWEFDEKQFGG